MKLKGCWTITLGVFVFAAGLSAWAVAEETEGLETGAAADPSADVATVEGGEDVEEAATGTDLALVLPPAPPRSLQSLVDERREDLQKRRRARFDLYTRRHLFMPPWLIARDGVMDRYRDVIREVHRQQRDYAQLHRDARMAYMSPWSKPFHDWAEARHYATQMEQLDWEELRDDLMVGPPFAYSGPFAPLY